jgi:hypothetical protein
MYISFSPHPIELDVSIRLQYSLYVIIKTASPIESWDEKEANPLLAAADQHIKALLDVLHIKIPLKVHYDFLYTLQRHFNVSLESSG